MEVILSFVKAHGGFAIVMCVMLVTPWIVGKLHHHQKVNHY
jgi:hypothetical protein